MTGGASFLHSIYGPQLSNLPFAASDVESRDKCRATNGAAAKPLVRPKSSPAGGRQQMRPRSAAPALSTRLRPVSARVGADSSRGRSDVSKIRPKSAAVGTVEYNTAEVLCADVLLYYRDTRVCKNLRRELTRELDLCSKIHRLQ